MGLNSLTAWSVTARAHVLIAETPGAFRLRVAVEQAIDAARWCQSETVADADVLVVIGSPGPEMMAIIDHTWSQMSEPRARVEVVDHGGIQTALTMARASLAATAEQRVAAHQRASQSMSPGDIGLAEGADDRDGLEMDELHLPLGPVLTHWPAGVVFNLTLNGDVVTSATCEQLDSPIRLQPPAQAPERAARLLDAASSLLSLAGLPAQSACARRLRDRCLTDAWVDPCAVDELATRLGRLRVLRWIWRKTTVADPAGCSIGLHDQLVGMVERAARSLRDEPAPAREDWPSLGDLPELVRGQELAAVRLWVTALSAEVVLVAEQEAARE